MCRGAMRGGAAGLQDRETSPPATAHLLAGPAPARGARRLAAVRPATLVLAGEGRLAAAELAAADGAVAAEAAVVDLVPAFFGNKDACLCVATQGATVTAETEKPARRVLCFVRVRVCCVSLLFARARTLLPFYVLAVSLLTFVYHWRGTCHSSCLGLAARPV